MLLLSLLPMELPCPALAIVASASVVAVAVLMFIQFFVAVRLCQQRGSQVVSTATNWQPEAVEVASVLSTRLWQPRPSSSKADHLFIISEQLFEIFVEDSTRLPLWNIELNL